MGGQNRVTADESIHLLDIAFSAKKRFVFSGKIAISYRARLNKERLGVAIWLQGNLVSRRDRMTHHPWIIAEGHLGGAIGYSGLNCPWSG